VAGSSTPAYFSFASWRRRALFAVGLASILVVVGYFGALGYLNAKWANAREVSLELDAGPTTNFLILGSDSRAFVASEQDAESFGEVGGTRADTIFVVRVDPDTRKALLVSFPRDLWVEIPGQGNSKINAAFQDGPQGVIDTLRANFDIPIHHYVEVDFAGFRNIVNAMGGVEMYVPAPARDAKTGLDIPQAGCTTLTGDQALAWVRSRQYQFFESGVWRSDPSGDIGRIQRQQDFIRRLIGQGLDAGARNPLRGDDLIDAGLENITIDSDLGVRGALKLVRVFRSGNPEDVEMTTVPHVLGRRGAASVVLLQEADAEPLFERLRGAGTLDGDVLPSNVSVRVLNGTGGSGVATRTARQLGEVGFLPGGIGDAERFGYSQTEIHYAEGAQAKAEVVKKALGGVGKLVADETVQGVDVVLVVGSDFAGVSDPGEARGVDLPIRRVAHVHGQAEGDPEPAGTDPSPEC